jgi:NAD kinase
MSLSPRVVVVHRRTEYEELIRRHGTRGQAAFFLSTRGRDLAELEDRHHLTNQALERVADAIPVQWRRGTVEREDIARFLFAPDDIVVAIGQDGLVANVAKYLDGQPVIGIDPEPGRNAGALVTHAPAEAAELLRSTGSVEERIMVQAVLDDGQRLLALNEIYLGHGSHQTARYQLTAPGAGTERQASSGLIVATGTGATGWCRSVALERHSQLAMPTPSEHRLLWFVREAWPSPATGTTMTEGQLSEQPLALVAESDRLVAFGDGIEPDSISLTWGQTVEIGVAKQRLRLVR